MRAVEQAPHQASVALVAALGHQLDGRVRGQTVAARVEVGPSRQDEAVEPIEISVDFEVAMDGRHHHRQAARGDDGVKIAEVETHLRAGLLAGRKKVGVDADEGPGLLGHRLLSWNAARVRMSAGRDAREYTDRVRAGKGRTRG